MARTNKPDPDAILWRKTGGGSFHAYINGRVQIIKPGQDFYAREDEIPENFRDLVVPAHPIAVARKQQEQAKVDEKIVTQPTHELKHRGGGWFNVVSIADGKTINEKALNKEAAQELLDSLNES